MTLPAKLGCFCILFCLLLPNVAQSSPPIPKSKKQALQSFEVQLEKEKQQKEELEAQVRKIDTDLSKTKAQLIETADNIQKNESKLKDIEQRIINLELRKSILDDKLLEDRTTTSRLILSLSRIRRTPPESMLARSETPYKTAQSALLMSRVLPSIKRHAEKLSKNLQTLNKVTEELEFEKETLLRTSDLFHQQHETLTSLLNRKKFLHAQTNDNIKAREFSIQKVSLQAQSLQDLIERIQVENQKESERQKKKQIAMKAARKAHSQKPTLSSGSAKLPVSGIIRIGYRQKDQYGAKSNGLNIESRPGALIIAPMNGKVQFTGNFKRYGNIVIIEHPQGYHSLIAGLDKIHATVGDQVKSGEPIGLLPNSSLIPRPTLYYELRQNGVAIDPAQKFSGLG